MRKYCAEKALQNNKPPGESSIIEKQIKKKKKKRNLFRMPNAFANEIMIF